MSENRSNSPLPLPPPGALGAPAPWFRVPTTEVVSIEHPCVVKNVEKAIRMLGGPPAIAQSLEKGSEKSLSLTFHPEDAASRPVISINNNTKNVLLKVIVPKRTGCKRKRGVGNSDPFVEDTTEPPPPRDASYLLRSLQDNPSTYEIEPVGTIHATHSWRSMPDFVYSTHSSPFLSEFRSKILPQQYPLLKDWSLPRTYGLTDTEVIPPPVLSTHTVPGNYTYRQNPAVKQVTDRSTGQKRLHNTQAPTKIHTHQCFWDTTPYPSLPPPSCPPLSSQPANLQSLVRLIQSHFDIRPVWTRRALSNQLPPHAPLFLARHAIAYVAYAIRSGPWRDTYCKLGVDPRTSPEYRKYQTVLLQLVTKHKERESSRQDFLRKWSRSRDIQSHIFTGRGPVPPDGKCWQLCDIEDPQIKSLVDIPDLYLNATCETRYLGWYPNGTNAKMRVALKAKVDALVAGRVENEAAIDRFFTLPEAWDGTVKTDLDGRVIDPMAAYLPRNATRKELEWASAYRSICRTPSGTVPVAGRGRLSKSKPDTRPSFSGDPGSDELLDLAEEEEDDGSVQNSGEQQQQQQEYEREQLLLQEDSMAGYEEPPDDDEEDDENDDEGDKDDLLSQDEDDVDDIEDAHVDKSAELDEEQEGDDDDENDDTENIHVDETAELDEEEEEDDDDDNEIDDIDDIENIHVDETAELAEEEGDDDNENIHADETAGLDDENNDGANITATPRTEMKR